MLFTPRLVGGELAPIFRLIDDYTNHITTTPKSTSCSSQRVSSTFKPKFDVRETKDHYEVLGDLPGVSQKDISIEFQDSQTLSIRGRTKSLSEEGQRPASPIQHQEEQSFVAEASDKEGYQKPTVEDESSASIGPQSEAPKSQQDTSALAQHTAQQPKSDELKYWLSERSVGNFARAFSFPTRIDQEGVKASLREGVLSIIIPKAAAPQSRRINIE